MPAKQASIARRAALRALSLCRRRSARIRDVLRTQPFLDGLSPADKALAFRLALGTTAAHSFLEARLYKLVKRPSALEPRVRDALLISSFELCYLDTPVAVAVSEGVELVRRISPAAAGLANAVLRRVSQEIAPGIAQARERCELLVQGDLLERYGSDGLSVQDIAQAAALPEWLADEILCSMGDLSAAELALSQLDPAHVWIAANHALHNDEALARLLKEHDLAAEPDAPKGAYKLASSEKLSTSGLVDGVDVVVCDAAAQAVCQIVSALPGIQLLELGQGRATKTVLLSSLAYGNKPEYRIYGVDKVASKVSIARERIRKAGYANRVECLCLDGRALSGNELPDGLNRSFDTVFLDAPCSGTGTMRRHPEIASRISLEEILSLVQLQEELLEAAAQRVAPGGYLVYSTCSVLRSECEVLVEGFARSKTGASFELVSCTELTGLHEESRAFVQSHLNQDGCFRSYPSRGGCDGHFCAVLKRR